jgi:hypothetical protein
MSTSDQHVLRGEESEPSQRRKGVDRDLDMRVNLVESAEAWLPKGSTTLYFLHGRYSNEIDLDSEPGEVLSPHLRELIGS